MLGVAVGTEVSRTIQTHILKMLVLAIRIVALPSSQLMDAELLVGIDLVIESHGLVTA